MGTEVEPFLTDARRNLELPVSSEQQADQARHLTPAFGQQVSRLRVQKGLSVAEAAKRVGIARQTLYRIENGLVSSPRFELVLRIAEALEVNQSLLLSRAPSSQAQTILSLMSPPPQSHLQPMVDKLGYWANMDTDKSLFDAADKQALLSLSHQVKKVMREGFIVREREKTAHSCVLLSGYAYRHKIVRGGARQIVAVHMKGDILDLQNSFLGVADHSVQALTDSEVAFIPRESIKKLAVERPRIAMAMLRDTLVDGSIFREWIANVGRRDVRERVAHLLCEFRLRLKVAGLSEESSYELPMTTKQLADSVGVTPVHLSRTLNALEAENLINRQNGQGITIVDWEKLAAAGDFDSNYLHLQKGEAAPD